MKALGSRLLGLLADVVLLAFFLTFAVFALNVVIQVIVLVVGYVQFYQSRAIGIALDGTRQTTDWKDLGLAMLIAAGSYIALKGALLIRRRMLHLFVDSGFASFVSKRYLIGREGGKLVGLIGVISVLGVAVGVMALNVVIGVMEGFDRELMKKFMGVYSHVEIRPYTGGEDEYMSRRIWTRLLQEVRELPEVEAAAPYINHQTLVQSQLGASSYKAPALIRGVDSDLEQGITDFHKYVAPGGNPTPGPREVVIGEQLALRLGVRVGDSIYAIGKIIPTANRTAAKTTQLRVAGIFKSGLYEADEKYIYASLETVQNLLVVDDEAGAVHLRLRDPQQAAAVKQKLRDTLPRGFFIRTWEELNPEFFRALAIEKMAMAIILLLIVVVASFNIIGTLVMTVVQKTREIGILKSMGATKANIASVFLLHGFFIGLLGTSLGTVWGLRLCRFVEKDIEKIFHLPGAVYGLDQLPVVVEPLTVGGIALAAFLICLVASIVPALQAARLNPVEALRYD